MDSLRDVANSGGLFPKEVVLSLSGEIAHELRTPLAVIQLYTELMEGILEHDGSGDLSDYSRVIKRTVRDTNYFIDSFLQQIRYISTGCDKVDRSRFRYYSMQQSLRELLKHYPFKGQERAAISLQIEENFYYHGEKILVIHVLDNLLKNALTALKEREEEGKIDIVCSKDGRGGVVTVTDSAGTMDEALSRCIFEQFTGKNASYKNGGIGLHFCHLVMKNLGGDITCESRPGCYTRFALRFPTSK